MLAKNIKNTEVFDKIILEFYAGSVGTRVTVHDMTMPQAIERCAQFGYVEPKWYEFWKTKLRVTHTISK